jgi:hypothetical protein
MNWIEKDMDGLPDDAGLLWSNPAAKRDQSALKWHFGGELKNSTAVISWGEKSKWRTKDWYYFHGITLTID